MSAQTFIKTTAYKAKLAGFLLSLVGSGFSISFCSIGLGIYLAGLLIELMADKNPGHPRFPQGQLLLLLLISLSISLFTSQYFKVSLRGFWKFAEGFILLYAAVDVIRTPKELRWVIGTLVAVFFLGALAGICQDLSGYDFVYFRQAMHETDTLPPRLIGAFKHYNDYSSFLVPGFGVLSALMIHFFSERRFLKAFLSALVVAMLAYCIARSLSRSAILAVFVSLFVFSQFFRYRWAVLIGLAVLAAAVVLIPSPISDRFHDLAKGSTAERILLFKISAAMVQAKPLFGLGLNTYSKYFPQFRPPDYPALMYAHNSYMQMAAEIGLIGITLYLVFIGSLLRRSAAAVCSSGPSYPRTLVIGFFAGVTGLLFNAFFESLLQSTQLRTLFWSLLGICVALSLNFLSKDRKVSS